MNGAELILYFRMVVKMAACLTLSNDLKSISHGTDSADVDGTVQIGF